MATIIPFRASNLITPTFIANLDGDDYEVRITWNISAQRYYVNINAQDGTWMTTVPLIQTPPARDVDTVLWDILQGVLIVTLVDPSLWPIPLSPSGIGTRPGTVIEYTFENFVPSTYNGKFRGLHVNETTFRITMPTDPGLIQTPGSVSRYLNMAAGIFNVSTLIYRNGCFEVNP